MLFRSLQTRPGLALTGNREALAAALGTQPVQVLNREERQDLLLYELLRADRPQKLVVYASRFQVSEATISHDLEDLRRRLEPLGLTITRSGAIQGSEEDRRRAMSSLVHDGVEYKTVDYLDPETALEQLFRGSAILSLLDQDILKRLLALLSANREQLGLNRFEQNSYIGLVIHLVIALERIKAGDPCREQLQGLPEMEDSRQEARKLISLLEQEFGLEFPDTEVDAVAFMRPHIAGRINKRFSCVVYKGFGAQSLRFHFCVQFHKQRPFPRFAHPVPVPVYNRLHLALSQRGRVLIA